jgi:nickel superoxide dismutase
MKRVVFYLFTAGFVLFLTAGIVSAHCEIPCGIYDDQLRHDLIFEHTQTIEKSINQITELSKGSPVKYNQLVRWISNKDHHATEIQHIVSQYFMTQRIKPTDDKYVEKLKLLHQMLISAMKCKQTKDLANVEALRSQLKEFWTLYHGHE